MEPTQIQSPAQNQTKSKKKLVWGLICLLGPTLLIVLGLLIYAVSNFIATTTAPEPVEGELFAQPSPISSGLNILLFLMGGVAILTWLPGIIVGIILLATRK